VLWVTAGIHGGEYPSIEAALRLRRAVNPVELTGVLIVNPIVDPTGFLARSMYVCTVDGKNVNRCFPGRADGSLSERIADALMTSIAPKVSHLVDLHGGDLVETLLPLVSIKQAGDPAVDAQARAMAHSFGIDVFVTVPPKPAGEKWDGTLTKTMTLRGVPALLAEAGSNGVLDEASVQLLYGGVRNVMRSLGMLPGAPAAARVEEEFLGIARVHSAHQGNFYSRIRVGDTVAKGNELGVIRDWLGDLVAPVLAPVDGRVLYIVTSLPVTKGGLLMGIGENPTRRQTAPLPRRGRLEE
jgi:predicted deacylase